LAGDIPNLDMFPQMPVILFDRTPEGFWEQGMIDNRITCYSMGFDPIREGSSTVSP